MIVHGILLQILAASLGTTSKQLIAYSEHVKKRWIFHIGATINIAVGPVVDASSYAFAPQVIIAPFACLDVIFNALTAPYTLSWQQEKITRVHILGTFLVASGAACTAIFGSRKDDVLNVYDLEAQLLRPLSLLYLGVELFSITTTNLLLKAQMLNAKARGIALGVIAGVLMGNVFCMKGVIGLVRHSIETGDLDAWIRPTPYILIAAAAGGAVLGHIFMRKGLGEYKGVFMVTIFEGAHITAACVSGCLVMSEMDGTPWWQYVLYWCSVATIILGMLIINTAAPAAKLGESNLAESNKSFHIAQQFVAVPTTELPIGRGAEWSESYPQPASTKTRYPHLDDGDTIMKKPAKGKWHKFEDELAPEMNKEVCPELAMGDIEAQSAVDLASVASPDTVESCPAPKSLEQAGDNLKWDARVLAPVR